MKKKMIMGINDMADPSISIVRDGKIIFYIEEERLTRVKHSHNQFPIKSIKVALKKFNIKINDLQAITYNWDFNKYQNGFMKNFFSQIRTQYSVDKKTLSWQNKRLKYRNLFNFKKKLKNYFHKEFNTKQLPKIYFYSHHYVHAFQSFKHSMFKEALCITIDGSGEENCTVVWECKKNRIKKLYEVNMPHSLGWFYAAFTEYLGFKAYDGEYKLMGLAAFGKQNLKLRKKISEIIQVNKQQNTYTINPKFIHYGKHKYSGRYTDNMVLLFNKKPKKKNENFSSWHKDLAYEVQKALEDSILTLCKKFYLKTGIKNFCMGGGVGLNVKLNSKIFKENYVENIFANPLCADSGASAGSALIADFQINNNRCKPLNSLSLGMNYSDKHISNLLINKKIDFIKPKKISSYIAKELAKKKVVGWFNGSMEAGPRALGNRSILADPRDKMISKKINKIIKYREIWRPFCPSILDYKLNDFFSEVFDSRFMTVSFDANKVLKKIAPAIVHVDGTCRIQSVSPKYNKKYYDLIKEFYKLTDVPMLLNTSFNIKGEPIVCSPIDALKTFFSTALDILVINNYVIKKNK